MPEKSYVLTAVETVEREYLVRDVEDEKQAKARLHLFFRDPDVLRDGLVTPVGDEEVNSRRVKTSRAATQSDLLDEDADEAVEASE